MITAEEYIKTLGRMCESYGEFCNGCPFKETKLVEGSCQSALAKHPAEVVAAVEKWGKENPEPRRKTYAEDFFEKFPDAPKDDVGQPRICRNSVYGESDCAAKACDKCWNEEMPDKEENDGLRK